MSSAGYGMCSPGWRTKIRNNWTYEREGDFGSSKSENHRTGKEHCWWKDQGKKKIIHDTNFSGKMVVSLIKFKCCMNCGFGLVCRVPGDSDTKEESSDEVGRCRQNLQAQSSWCWDSRACLVFEPIFVAVYPSWGVNCVFPLAFLLFWFHFFLKNHFSTLELLCYWCLARMAQAYPNMVASFLFIFLFIKKVNGKCSSHLSCLAIGFNASALLLEKYVGVFRGSSHTAKWKLWNTVDTYFGKSFTYTFKATA